MLEDPNFVAGVVDNRSTFYDKYFEGVSVDYSHPRVAVTSPNRPLLIALRDKFKGKVVPRKGSFSDNAGYVWRLEKESTRFLEEVLPHALIVAEEIKQTLIF